MTNLISILFIALVNFFTLNYTTVTGGTQGLGTSSGKKVLLVNVATGSPLKVQLQQLETLYQQHKDSLDIIVFPSNSFGHEGKTNAQLQQYFTDSIGAHYKVAALSDVTGTGINSIYGWLKDQQQNGTVALTVTKDYQKVLVDRDGTVSGMFRSTVTPLDSTVQKAVSLP